MDLSLPQVVLDLERACKETVRCLLSHEREWVETGEVPEVVKRTIRDLGYLDVMVLAF